MKTYCADEGMTFRLGEQVLGSVLYTPDDFDETHLEQVPLPSEEVTP